MYRRRLELGALLKSKSHFLFGPRATGKTTLIQQNLPGAVVVDLLHHRTFSSLLRDPSRLGEMIVDRDKIVVIDEIQKLPKLLDEVHRLIQRRRIRFLLTGSSARKLKHGGANLLAGRARKADLFPLCFPELPNFSLEKMLNHGGIPDIYDSEDVDEDLAAYVDTYLREEIKAEAVTRNVEAFVEFLDAVAVSNGGGNQLRIFRFRSASFHFHGEKLFSNTRGYVDRISAEGFCRNKKTKGNLTC